MHDNNKVNRKANGLKIFSIFYSSLKVDLSKYDGKI